MKWTNLPPSDEFLDVLNIADGGAPQPFDGDVNAKRNWGNRLANACAIMVANELKKNVTFRKYEIRPNSDGTGTESSIAVAGGKTKKVDVVASSLITGLQVALSLKASNFPGSDRKYGKNVTNRLYELQDEVLFLHEHQPKSTIVGIYYLPVAACFDQQQKSTFARTVGALRARVGRLHYSLAADLRKLDAAFIGLYSTDARETRVERGVIRYFDVNEAPPKFGRPKLKSTLTLKELVKSVENTYLRGSNNAIEYTEPEAE